ncbi:putative ankyrin repeat domain-containing protein 26-like protein [Vicugna pacos]|uniref:Ankyrin repeat domain-containing protein 26-like protein n=1 Tax=Vicugna pacos TaxID=30538 RepID=A0ABM5DN91_VICPA
MTSHMPTRLCPSPTDTASQPDPSGGGKPIRRDNEPIFCFCHANCESPVGCTISPQRDHRNSQPGYHIRRRDLKKIHRAACVGDVRKVQRVLFLRQNGLDVRDRKNRTALHLASANGHGGVLTLLLERGCQVDAQDRKKRTALIKAIQCEAEECVDILLKSGANVNTADVLGNTALHYAACLDTASIAEKLLSHTADMDVKNHDDLTPLLFAIRENRQQMAEFLKEKQANIHTVEKMKSEQKDERRRETPFQNTSLSKTSDCETSAVYSAEDKDAQSLDTEEGVTQPEIQKEETGTETDGGDQGAPVEPTDEKKWTSVDGADTPDMAVKLQDLWSFICFISVFMSWSGQGKGTAECYMDRMLQIQEFLS